MDIKLLQGDFPLGKDAMYEQYYNPALLCAISRDEGRSQIGVGEGSLPFNGVDIWTGYELSWLNGKGRPMVACARFFIPCSTDGMIESKSFKLYLNSFNQTRFDSIESVKATIKKDLSGLLKSSVDVEIQSLGDLSEGTYDRWPGFCLDELDVEVEDYAVNAGLLCADSAKPVEDEVYTHLFKSNCPVTGQPDWASLLIRYQGNQIERETLLKYLCSYRQHSGFHEQCVERIFMDVLRACAPERLTIEARFLRRGGLDINPFRTNCAEQPLGGRLYRQ